VLHVHSDTPPDTGFIPIDGTLEDVYFSTIADKMDVALV